MNKNMWKTTLREIRSSLGRYLAILAITALGVGFFSGLKITRQTMVDAGDGFISELNMFDYRLVSTIGLEQDDVDEAVKLPYVEHAYGAYQADAVVNDGNKDFVVKFHSLDRNINKVKLTAGRLPEAAGEIVADARHYSANDLDKTLRLSETNKQSDLDKFDKEEYRIVGIAYSPIYLNYERGTTSIGNGSVSCFCFMLPENFSMAAYTDIYITLQEKEYIFSDEYVNLIESHKADLETFLEERAEKRYNRLFDEMKIFFMGSETTLSGFGKPSTVVLTRAENIGYACFENDSSIVDGIAVVFPVFFFLVAALVCITTMSRMIEEQRTQIGVLKALGYGEGSIMAKYMFYSGSAALIGCIGGFFLGCYAFPAIIWKVYGLMYGFTDIKFVFNGILFSISLLVSLLCSVGTTWYSCKKDLRQKSAELLRPKAPKSGKRVFLENIGWLWKRIPFLSKVSVRNTFRYKGRFFMMILGIGGCTGLLITGFGISDSITEIAEAQYTQILIYDEQVNFSQVMDEEKIQQFISDHDAYIEDLLPVYQTSVDPVNTKSFRSLTLTVLEKEERMSGLLSLHTEDRTEIAFPGQGEVVITSNVAKSNDLNVGDTVTFRDSDYQELELTVSGICENFFGSYAYISGETYLALTGKEVPYKSAFVKIMKEKDLHEALTMFVNDAKVSSVSVNADTRERFAKMIQRMDYIVIMVTVCAAALALIVLYNLTNINITERLREIATIKVLGFYSGETAAYVFRENMTLTVLGAIVGIPIGIALQRYVMWNIKIDMITFDVHINGISYVYAILFTIAFALFVDFVMYFKISRINMAESLKSVE